VGQNNDEQKRPNGPEKRSQIAQVLGVAVDPLRPEKNLQIPKQMPDDKKNQNDTRRRHDHFPSDG
jgi:hypothetical protein